jgi:hypothetical protein
VDPDLQVDLLAYWTLCHATSGAKASDPDYQPTTEDLRLMLARGTTPGDLAWLWNKVRPKDPKKELAKLYVEPEARGDDLQAEIAALFIHYPEGEA